VDVSLFNQLNPKQWQELSWKLDSKEVAQARNFRDLVEFVSKSSRTQALASFSPMASNIVSSVCLKS